MNRKIGMLLYSVKIHTLELNRQRESPCSTIHSHLGTTADLGILSSMLLNLPLEFITVNNSPSKVTSMRCIIKAACTWKFGIEKSTKTEEVRKLLTKNSVVPPDEWFQAMLSQGCLLLNAALTASTDGSVTTSKHTSFWRPIIRQVINETFDYPPINETFDYPPSH